MVKSLKKGPLPKLRDVEGKLKNFSGFNIIYSKQCPGFARSINELTEIAEKNNLKPKITELKTTKEAQNAPSIYGIFSIVYNGILLADNYISARRF